MKFINFSLLKISIFTKNTTMSNGISDELQELIKAMTKSEKRYFSLSASRLHSIEGKKFVQLFSFIDKRKKFDEKKFLRLHKHIQPVQLYNLKAHLQKQLLNSLLLFHASHNIDLQIRNLISQSQVLYNKSLYDSCVKLLDRARKMAVANDRSMLLLEITELEKTAILHTVAENNEARVNKIISETNTVSKSIRNINTFSNLAARLNAFYVKVGFSRTKADFENVKKFFFSGLPVYNEKKLSFHEKLYLYLSFVSYYSFVQDFRKSHLFAKKWVKLFDENPEMIRHQLELYIKGINHLLVSQNKLFLFSEFEETYKKLLRVHSIPKIQLTENIQLLLFKYKYMHKINHYFMMGDFTSGTKIISVAENELDRFARRMDKHYVLLFYYKVACLYFGSGNFNKAVVWLNKIINSKDVDLREDILSFARILNLISHFELGNFDLMESLIRSTYRFLLKKQEHFRYHRLILRFLKNLPGETEGKELTRRFSELKKQLLPLENNPREKRPFLYFDIISWLESKEKGVTAEKIIREKSKQRIQ